MIDAHTHLASLDFIPLPFIEGVADNMRSTMAAMGVSLDRARILDRCLAALQDEDGDEQVAEMRAAGITRSVLLLADFTHAVPGSRLTIEEMFHRHRAAMHKHPDSFWVFGGVDPRWGLDGVRLFERSVAEWGFTGFKVYPPCGFSPSDERLFPFYEVCAQHGLPVLVHIGPTSPHLSFEYSSPFHIDAAARSFPTVNFILAHGAAHHVEESVMLCEYRPNVYLDLSGLQAKMRVERAAGYHRHVFHRGINHKIIFGTDWPLFRMQGSTAEFVEQLAGAEGVMRGVSKHDRDQVFRGNIGRLLPAAAAGAR